MVVSGTDMRPGAFVGFLPLPHHQGVQRRIVVNVEVKRIVPVPYAFTDDDDASPVDLRRKCLLETASVSWIGLYGD